MREAGQSPAILTPSPSDLSSALAAGLRDRYALERELGRGGMATVFLSMDLRHDRRVALNVLRRALAAELETGRFLEEIRLVAGLTHPHILPLHDSGEAEGLLYYVMPFIEGESLRDRLTQDRILGYTYGVLGRREEAMEIVRQLRGEAARRWISPLFESYVLRSVGDLDGAFRALQAGYEQRSGFIALMGVEPLDDVLRRDPRYRELCEKVGVDSC
jgi:serine/threonine protein kinase